MEQLHTKEVDELFKAILLLESAEDCYDFFEDACTIKEITEIAKRLRIAKMLDDDMSYSEIAGITGVSTATICRVNKCLNYGTGGYRKALDKIYGKKEK